MKVEPEPGFKFVWYYGRKLEIPEDHYFVAADESWWIWSFKYRPMKNCDVNCWDYRADPREVYVWQPVMGRDHELAERWQDTLVEYPTDYKFEEKKQ